MDAHEPHPIWTEAPRYAPPGRDFPAYRFVPGRAPHPRRDPEGHAFGIPEEKPAYIGPDRWRENALYLHGVDLYHQGYLWESHEAWETLWHLTKKEDVEGQFLQALIQNAAALLKVFQGQWDGARHLSGEVLRRLQFVTLSGATSYMGVDVIRLVRELEAYYAPLKAGKDAVQGPPPRLELR